MPPTCEKEYRSEDDKLWNDFKEVNGGLHPCNALCCADLCSIHHSLRRFENEPFPNRCTRNSCNLARLAGPFPHDMPFIAFGCTWRCQVGLCSIESLLTP